MHWTIRRSLATALALSLTALGCDSPTGVGSGTLNLALKDAPGDVRAAVVTIDQIYLQPDSGDAAGRIILRDQPVTTDLLKLVDSTQSLVEGAQVPAGRYSQLRFVISGAYLAVEGDAGTTQIFASSPTYAGLPAGATVAGALQMPSFAQSGLKVQLPDSAVTIVEDGTMTLVVDFDVAQSFGKQAGSSGRWVMTPVLTGSVPPSVP